jgi:riboflavin synthase
VFTGLIAEVGRVRALHREEDGVTLTIACGLAEELAEGDSVAVNGVCLTATAIGADSFDAEAMNETLSRSSLANLEQGAGVNLELALRPADRLGGHFVQGHVDGTGVVGAVRADGFSRVVTVGVEQELGRYMVEKGSVALDGVSLTVSALSPGGFSVSLIPETLKRTTLGTLREGQIVNIEADVLAKHIERLIESHAPGVRT